MSFLVPGFVALTVLAGVPIALHLLGRPRAERRPFAAMAFLFKSDRRTAAKTRLRQLLLLAARVLVLAVVPLLLAKPIAEVATDLPVGLGGVESAVIVVDDSRSLTWQRGGASLFERARERARVLVDGLGHGSEAALFLTSRGAAPPEPDLTSDRERLRHALAELRPSRRPGDTSSALRRAAALLAHANHPTRRVYLISDLAAHGFTGDLASAWSAEGAGSPSLVPLDVAAGAPLPNCAVAGVRTEPAPELGPRGVRIAAEIANFGDDAVKGLEVTLRVDGKAVAKGLVDLPARGRAIKRFVHAFAARGQGGERRGTDEETPRTPRSASRPADTEPPGHDGEIDLAGAGPDAAGTGDGLADDDRRFFRLEERRSVRVLLVDGDPRTIRRDDEVYFLETALHPGDLDDFQFDVTVTTPDELGRRGHSLGADADVVVLANVKALDAERAASLRAFVDKGGGLFLSLGANVEPDAWNAAFGALLPQPLATLRTVGATLDARDDGEARGGGPGERIDRFDARHPLLEVFGGGGMHGAAESLREARVGRYALLKPSTRTSDEGRRVLLRLEGGAPLLVEGGLGAGRVLLLTTTADRDWSDLAIQPAFLPLVQQSVRYLAGAMLRETAPPPFVGERHAIPLATGDTALEVTLPSGQTRHFGGDKVAGREAFDFGDTDAPGIYRVAAGEGDHPLRPRPAAAFVVNVDPSESDLQRIEPARLAALIRPPAAGEETATPRRRVELWHALGAALLALLLIEGALAIRRG